MKYRILLVGIILSIVTKTCVAQTNKTPIKKDDEKNIDVDYVKFDTATSYFYNNCSYKDFMKMQEDEEKGKVVKNRWEKQEKTYPRYAYSTNGWHSRASADNLDYVLTRLLKKTGYIDTVNQIFKNEKNMMYLQPVIGEEHYYYVYDVPTDVKKVTTNISKCKIDVLWRITNVYSEAIDSVKITTEMNNYDTGKGVFNETLFEKFFTQALNQVLANNKIGKYFKLNNETTALTPTTITKPTVVLKNATEAQIATVIVKTEKGHGSGFAISNDGYIVTNYHVIASKNLNKPYDVTIILEDGSKVKATFIKANKDRDLALLKAETKFTKCFEITNQKNFKTFEELYAMGAPKSIELGQSATKGILSSERNINGVSLLQLSMNINSGNSGGPIFNTNAGLVGVVCGKLFGFGVEGVAFGLPGYKLSEYLAVEFK